MRKKVAGRPRRPLRPNAGRFADVTFDLPLVISSGKGKEAFALVLTVAVGMITFSLLPVVKKEKAKDSVFIMEEELPEILPPKLPEEPPEPLPKVRAHRPKPVPKQFGLEAQTLGETSDLAVAMGNAVDVKADSVVKLGGMPAAPVVTDKSDEDGLVGKLVSATRITRMPKVRVSAKPEYSAEMKKNNVSGKVKAKVLVDIDGRAAKIVILDDLGYGTKELTLSAIRKLEFEPGMMGDSAVAVWIPFAFKFELQE
ncbi:MAG: energy transducer TonB [Fibrobacterota bacterium]|nr:energy transducer TonB [Fibrobacterota bacterium]